MRVEPVRRLRADCYKRKAPFFSKPFNRFKSFSVAGTEIILELTELITQSVKAAWSSARFLEELIRLELERQEERRIKQAICISHLPVGPTISNFDFAYQPSVSRNQIETLSVRWTAMDGDRANYRGEWLLVSLNWGI